MRRHVVCGLGLGLLLAQTATADVTVIYRTQDQTVAAIAHDTTAVETELSNVLRSELGGRAEDYATVTVPDAVWAQRGSRRIVVNPDGQVSFALNPKHEAKQAAKASARGKLKAMGLTTEELDALFDR